MSVSGPGGAVPSARGTVREERGAWAVFGIGMAFFGAAYGHYFAFLKDLQNPPYPSLSDAVWLVYYAGAVVALLLLMRARLQHFRRGRSSTLLWGDWRSLRWALRCSSSRSSRRPVAASQPSPRTWPTRCWTC